MDNQLEYECHLWLLRSEFLLAGGQNNGLDLRIMASSKRRGLGETLKEILARAQIPRFPFSRQGDMGPILRSVLGSRRKPVSESPSVGTPTGRPRPGLGESGLQRIQEALVKFREEPPTVSEEPPDEPPTEDSSEEEEILPPPEHRKDIPQSTKPYRYKSARPDSTYYMSGGDKVYPFHKDGPKASTRVRAMQWIPKFIDNEEIIGDLFVAFARPSKDVGSSLVLYEKVTRSAWDSFRGNISMGAAVKQFEPTVPHGEDKYQEYRKLHPDYTGWWIFDNLAEWTTIRPNNSRDGETSKRRPKSTAGRAREFGRSLEEKGFSAKDFKSKRPDDDY